MFPNPSQFRKSRTKYLLHGEASGIFGDLRDQTQPLVGINEHFTLIIVHLTGEDVKKGGLAAAVTAKDRYPLPFLNFERKIFQKVFSDHEELC